MNITQHITSHVIELGKATALTFGCGPMNWEYNRPLRPRILNNIWLQKLK